MPQVLQLIVLPLLLLQAGLAHGSGLKLVARAASIAAIAVRNMVQAGLLLQTQPDAADFPLPDSFKHRVQQVQCSHSL